MANLKFREKEINMRVCSDVVSRLEEDAVYFVSKIGEYEERGLDTLGAWEIEDFNDCKLRITAIDRIITHLEKLI